MIHKRLKYLLVCFLFIPFNSFCQDNILAFVNSSKVKHYLKKENLTTKKEIVNLNCLCADTTLKNSFYSVADTFFIDESVERAWDLYQKIPMDVAWNIKKAKFQFLFNPSTDQLQFKEEASGSLEKGQLYFIKLKLLAGLVNLVVANKLNNIDDQNHVMEFCYLENGVTKGSQYVKFISTGNHSTKIIHETYYKSESKFRDTILYPSIHEKIIKQFHENVKKQNLKYGA